MRQPWRAAASLIVVAMLPACISARFGGEQTPRAVMAAPSRGIAEAPTPLEPAPAAPAGVVTAEPLAPLPGTTVTADPSVPAPGGPIIADIPPPASPAPPQVAALNPPPAPSGPSRSSVLGGWTARDATGSTCRVTLSSSPALDLYRATAANCQNRDLARVSAWDFRDGEVYLYQPGGAVAARLRAGGGSLDGALTKSGAPLTLAR